MLGGQGVLHAIANGTPSSVLRATILIESSGAAALGLLLIDIDYLKRSNDDDGHAVRSNSTPDRDLTSGPFKRKRSARTAGGRN